MITDNELDAILSRARVIEQARKYAKENGIDYDDLLEAAGKALASYGPDQRTAKLSSLELDFLGNHAPEDLTKLVEEVRFLRKALDQAHVALAYSKILYGVTLRRGPIVLPRDTNSEICEVFEAMQRSKESK